MTDNQKKYEDWSRPVLWTGNQAKAQKSMFQYRLDEDTEKYFITKLGVYNGFLGLFSKVMYYLSEEDACRTVRKCW